MLDSVECTLTLAPHGEALGGALSGARQTPKFGGGPNRSVVDAGRTSKVRSRGRGFVGAEAVQVQRAVGVAGERTRTEVGECGSRSVLDVARVGSTGLLPAAVGDGVGHVRPLVLLEGEVPVIVDCGRVLDRRYALVVILIEALGWIVECHTVLEHMRGAVGLIAPDLEAVAVPGHGSVVVAVVICDAI